MQSNEEKQERVEDAVLHAGERMSDVAFEKYVDGELSPDVLEEVYQKLTLWRSTSEKILELIVG